MKLNNTTVIKKTDIFDSFINIILNKEISKSIYSEGYVSDEDIIKYVKLFFKNYDDIYYKQLLQAFKSKKVLFDPLCNSAYDISNDIININSSNTIRDASILVHEFMHRQNIKQDKGSFKNPFRELLSIMHEKIFSDYLSSSILDYKDPIIIRMQNDIEISEQARLGIEFYKSGIDNSLTDMFFPYASQFLDSCKASLDDCAYYLIGALFSSYIHQNTLSKNFNINDLKHIRDFIISRNYNDLSHILDIDFYYDNDGLNIANGSVKKLSKEYVKEVEYYER